MSASAALYYISLSTGEKVAFEELFEAYYQPLCRYAEALLNDGNQAEDVVQDLFVYLLSRRISIAGKVESYFFSAVKRRAFDILRHQVMKHRHNPALSEFFEDMANSGYSEEEAAQMQQIKQALEELPPQCRRVFTMSCIDGKSYKEIAEELNLSINTVKAHIKKGYEGVRAKTAERISKKLTQILTLFFR